MKPFRPLSLALLVALPAAAAFGQPTVVTLKDLKPRQVQSAVFTLASPQDLHVDAVGAEAASQGGTFGWIATMWSPKPAPSEPWMGNAWILDLCARSTAASACRPAPTRRSTPPSPPCTGPTKTAIRTRPRSS